MVQILFFAPTDEAVGKIQTQLNSQPDVTIVGIAHDLDNLLQKIQDEQPDLLLLDLDVLAVNPVERYILPRELRGQKVILLGENHDTLWMEQALRSGAKAYVAKTASDAELMEAINGVNDDYIQIAPRVFSQVLPIESTKKNPPAPPQYSQTAVNPQFPSSSPQFGQGVYANVNPSPPAPETTVSEIQVIEEVEIDFLKYWLIFKRRWLKASFVFLPIIALAGLAFSRIDPYYKSSGKLLLKIDKISSLTGLGDTRIDDFQAITEKGDPLKTESEILLSTPVLAQVIELLEIQDDEGEFIKPKSLREVLSVSQVSGTDILKISCEYPEAEETADIINTLMDIYIEDNIRRNKEEAQVAYEFVIQQLPKTEARVREAEAEVRNFKEKNKLFSIEQESRNIINQVDNLSQNIINLEEEISGINSRMIEIQNRVGISLEDAQKVIVVNQSPSIQKVMAEIETVETQLTAEQSRFQDIHPTIIELKERQQSLRILLQEKLQEALRNQDYVVDQNLRKSEIETRLLTQLVDLEVQRYGLVSRWDYLKSLRDSYLTQFNTLPKLEQQQQELERKLNAANGTYENLLNRQQELEISVNQTIGNAEILEEATVPKDPSLGNKPILILLGSGFVGTLLFLAMMIILELSDQSIQSLPEVREIFDYSLLGVIPEFKKFQAQFKDKFSFFEQKSLIFLRDNPQSPISELYRTIQGNLDILMEQKGLKTVMITSAILKEGRSVTTANLAAAIAELSDKVLIIDLSWRSPTQHELWQIDNQQGIHYLLEHHVNYRDVAQRVFLGLDVIPCETDLHNLGRLFRKEGMKKLMQSVSYDYDYVLIDAPPLLYPNDILNLSALTDGLVLVTQPGLIDEASARVAQDFLKRLNQNILGLVFNHAKLDNDADDYLNYTRYMILNSLD